MAERLSLSTGNKPVCLSDRIKQYIDYALVRLPRDPETKPDELKSKAYDLYQQIRGDLFINGKDPRIVAAAILFLAVLLTGYRVTQIDIASTINVGVDSVRSMCKKMKTIIQL